jgi:hypothetical protein
MAHLVEGIVICLSGLEPPVTISAAFSTTMDASSRHEKKSRAGSPRTALSGFVRRLQGEQVAGPARKTHDEVSP